MSSPQFIKPYPNGYIDGEVGNTPVTAAILNTNYDGFLLALNEFLPELEGMVEANPSEAATAGNLTKLKVGNSIYLVPSGGSGGSTVEWEQIQLTGTKIATITIDNVPIDVYAPSGGGSGDEVSWTQVVGSGTKIGTITINGTPTDVYAPTPIDVEANPSGSATAGDLTKLRVGSSIYSIPSGGSGGASDLSDLGDVTITNVQNGQILKWNSTTSKWENVNDTGGGSGHTIIDENGNSMTARAGLQFVGGANVDDDATNNKTIVDLASAGGIDGVFIDTGNVIVQETQISASGLSYTATEDCFVCLYLWGSNSTSISIDGNYIAGNFSTDKQTFNLFLKKGQTLTTTSGNANNTYTVYGIQTGTTHSKFQPVIYSTEEREIGVWTDGRPLYEKTVDFGALPNNTTKTVSYNISDLDYFVKIQCVAHNQNGSRNIPFVDDVYKSGDVLLDTIKSSGVIRIISHNDLSSLTGEVTLQYVKTTDVAGSGTWTPQGVPTHHYSTDEQVIGTWIDGSTIYEKTIYAPTGTFITVSDWTQISGFSNIGKMIDTKINVVKGTESRSVYQRSDNVDTLPRFEAYNGEIYYFTDTNTFAFYNWDWYITFQYTKSS